MSVYIDHKYVGLLSPSLDKFARKSDKLYNCRCPICGDSKSNRSKARGYIYDRKNALYYRCHNCGASLSLGNFIKQVQPSLYSQYTLEKYKDGATGHGRVSSKAPEDMFDFSAPKFSKKISDTAALEGLCRIDTLPAEHQAVAYLTKRKIPQSKLKRLFYTEDFQKWSASLSEKYFTLPENEARIVIPYWDEEGRLFAAQGRSLDNKNSLRYITVRFDEETPKVYGLDTWDKTKHTIVVEGPIDSLFLENSVAMGGADIPFELFDKSNTVFVFDNERRNKEIVDRLEKTIDRGFKVCIFPEVIAQKDINDMILAGATSAQLMKIIEKNTYEGLSAKVTLSNWKRI